VPPQQRPVVVLVAAVAAVTLLAAATSCSFDEDNRAGTISTVVGTGDFGTEGVGGPALQAQLMTPVDIAFDPDGNLYIAERYNHRILKVDSEDTLSVVAGTGEPGFSGDGGAASKAQLASASGVAVDSQGNMYIADTANNRIRKVDHAGTITTIAGNGRPEYSGDGGPAVKAAINGPAGMAFDAEDNLYIADHLNYRIRKIDREGTITTVAGTGRAGLSPDGTPATEARIGDPTEHVPVGLAFDGDGRLHFADLGNNRVGMIDGEGRMRSAVTGLGQPLDITFDSDGNLYVTTHDHGEGVAQRIRKVDKGGNVTTFAGTGATDFFGDGGPAVNAKFNIPCGLAIGPDGNLYVTDANNNVVRMIEL
jgi:DNA-binding beta-propeller fold protein YncE